MDNYPNRGYVGILLAAGRGSRFDGGGLQNKLLQILPGGNTVVNAAANNLRAALGSVLAVTPTGSPALAINLAANSIAFTKCINAGDGMAASLMHGIRQTQNAAGWIIALGDMPFVAPTTISLLVDALALGADIAVPVCNGVRGHPVGFSRCHLANLLQLSGDSGARKLLQEFPVCEIPVDDPGICRDIDTPLDLQQCWTPQEMFHG